MQIGHRQGTPRRGQLALYDIGLRKGYAIVHSSGTRIEQRRYSSRQLRSSEAAP